MCRTYLRKPLGFYSVIYLTGGLISGTVFTDALKYLKMEAIVQDTNVVYLNPQVN
jgi:hypothetical protein